jgi:DNA adenine methylase
MGWMYREPGDLDKKSPVPGDSIIRWLGGKSKMIDDLIRWFPPHFTYIEVFGGSLKPFFSKKPSNIEIVNDYYEQLINFWRIASQWGRSLANACNAIPASRTLHRIFQREDGSRDPWVRAVMFGALVRFSFNGKPWSSYGGSPVSQASQFDENLMAKIAKRLSDHGVYIENLDFRECIERYNKKSDKDIFFYLDPPYLGTTGYANAFPNEWHVELADLMNRIDDNGNKVLMTNSEQAENAYRKWLKGNWRYNKYTVRYSAGGDADSRGDVNETIISNFDINVKQQMGLFNA